MIRGIRNAIVLWSAITAVVASADPYLSPLAIAVRGDRLYVVDTTADRVVAVNPMKARVVRAFPTSDAPSGIAVSPDGKRLYVTAGAENGRVFVLNARTGKCVAELVTGHSPNAPVVSADGNTLFVCNQFTNDVSIFDLAANTERCRVPVTREPVAAALTPNGASLIVANLIPKGSATSGYVAATVDVVDTNARAVRASIVLPNGSVDLRGVCVSPDGAYAYVTHLVSRYQLPTTQLERGWVNTNAVSVLDLNAMTLINTVLLDDVDMGAANPWGVACSPDGARLLVAHAGSHEISVIDRGKLHQKLSEAAANGGANTVPNDLAFMVGLRERRRLAGKGPRGIAVSGPRVFAAEYYSGSIGVIDLAQEASRAAVSISLGQAPEPDTVRAGEILFHDADYCFQRWQSCASCHPGGARVDSLNWDMLNDGLGTPKNTKSLLLSHQTPPAMATGVRETAEVAVRAGIRNSLFNTLDESYAVKLDEYLKSLTPVPSPLLVNGALSDDAERGKQVFDTAKCSRCHPAPLFTDLKSHRVGTGMGIEQDKKFDTPTLVEVWRTAPYLHDGRAATIRDVITIANESGDHGDTSELSQEQIDDLAAYVMSL
ncbi:MAG: c-type cytochrome [Candidatus Hydrogenedentes bacterium]|nr:c-type cytochrome [Candidatus Hydrogenedentota bacterium]